MLLFCLLYVLIELYNEVIIMNIGQRIKKRREQLGLTQEELATITGYKSRSSINKIELDGRGLPQSKIVSFAKALNTTPAYLMGWEEEKKEDEIYKYKNIYPIELKKFPLLGEIACGEPIFCVEDRESYVLAGADIKADFCLKAKGDSMINARILDGDIVFIRKQSLVENGEIAAVIVDDEATLKRVSYFKDKNMLILKPENPKYNDLIYMDNELEQIRILGKAVAFQSDVK